MRYRARAALLALTLAFTPSAASADDNDIRLSGCLVRGQNGKGYLVTNVPGEAAWQRSADAIVVPGPVGTSGTVASILYWLEQRDGLDEHAGHYVEVEGKVRGDLAEGEIELTPRSNWTEVEVESGGTSLQARVPRSLLIVPDRGSRRLEVLVRRVVPERVRMLAAACGR